MKRLLGLSLPVLLLMVGCKKDTDPALPPTETISPAVSFSQSHYGLEQLNTNSDITSIVIQQVPAGRTFSYEITAANGLKNAADVILKGTGKTVIGKTEIPIEQHLLYKYKDGDLYLTVKLDSTGETARDTVLKDEYVVRTYADLRKIIYSFSDAYPDQPYVQAQDIVCPDGNTSNGVVFSFKGIYDGQNHKITNFNYTTPASSGAGLPEFPGLFKSLSGGAIVKNIRLEMSATGIRSTQQFSDGGGIAGIADSSSIINCSVTGNISGDTTSNSWSSLAGIVGVIQHSNIIGCSHTGNISARTVGGIAGSGHSSTIRMCYKTGTINAGASGSAGGFLGSPVAGMDYTNVKIFDSYVYLTGVRAAHFYAAYNYAGTTASADFNNYFSNIESDDNKQEGVTLYTAIAELNNHLSGISITGLPEGIMAPASGKPYKAVADQSLPMILWWQ